MDVYYVGHRADFPFLYEPYKHIIPYVCTNYNARDGSMSTGHGNSIKGMLNRLETMYMSDSQISVASVRNQIANAVDVFIHLRRDADGRRRVCEVAELTGFDGRDYIINYLYRSGEDGMLVPTGNALNDRERLIRAGLGHMMRGDKDD